MSATLLLAYMIVGLLFWVHGMVRLVGMERGRRRGLEALDRVLLGGVALLGSAAWILLLGVYAVGWLRSRQGQRALGRIRALAFPPRTAAVLGR
jgi:hypothetical protein